MIKNKKSPKVSVAVPQPTLRLPQHSLLVRHIPKASKLVLCFGRVAVEGVLKEGVGFFRFNTFSELHTQVLSKIINYVYIKGTKVWA